METGGEVTKNMILAVVNMVEHEYDYVGSGKQMWEESCGTQSQVALGSACPGLLSPAGTMSAPDFHLLVITLKTAAPHSLPLQSLVPFSLSLFRFPCCLLVQRHCLSLLPSSIPSAGTLHRILTSWVSPILFTTEGDSDNESNMKRVRAHLVKRIISCQVGMDGKELLRRVTRGPFVREMGSGGDLGPQ